MNSMEWKLAQEIVPTESGHLLCTFIAIRQMCTAWFCFWKGNCINGQGTVEHSYLHHIMLSAKHVQFVPLVVQILLCATSPLPPPQ